MGKRSKCCLASMFVFLFCAGVGPASAQSLAMPNFEDCDGRIFQVFTQAAVMAADRQFDLRGMGNGIMIDPAGYLLVNNHTWGPESITKEICRDESFPRPIREIRLSALFTNGEKTYAGKTILWKKDGDCLCQAGIIGTASLMGDNIAALVAVDKSNDLAILKISDRTVKSHKHLSLCRTALPEIGERVFLLNYFNMLVLSVGTRLEVSEKEILSGRLLYQNYLIKTDNPVKNGYSGGALLNGRGEMVGLLSFAHLAYKDKNGRFGAFAGSRGAFAIGPEPIIRLLDQAKKK